MKKIITLLLLLLAFSSTYSQILFQDDFDGSGPGLSAWTLIDNDGLTPHPNVSFVNNAWVMSQDTGKSETDIVAVSNSWYSPIGTADDWMITPPIAIDENFNAEVTWDVVSRDEDVLDSYEVLISTSGNTIGDFTQPAIWSEDFAPSTWTTRTVDLSAYNNQTIYIAWRNNSTDKYVLQINNVKVEKKTTLSDQESQMGTNFITVYPNPSSDHIIVSGLNKNEHYSIYNVLGVEMGSGMASDNQKLNIQNLTRGLYFLKFDNGNSTKFIKK